MRVGTMGKKGGGGWQPALQYIIYHAWFLEHQCATTCSRVRPQRAHCRTGCSSASIPRPRPLFIVKSWYDTVASYRRKGERENERESPEEAQMGEAQFGRRTCPSLEEKKFRPELSALMRDAH